MRAKGLKKSNERPPSTKAWALLPELALEEWLPWQAGQLMVCTRAGGGCWAVEEARLEARRNHRLPT